MKHLIQKNLHQHGFTLSSLGLILFTAACSPKVQPTATMNAEHLAQGKAIFTNSCSKCHDLPNPGDHTAQEWVGIMNWMAPKAKLNDAQHQMVYDYIVSAKEN